MFSSIVEIVLDRNVILILQKRHEHRRLTNKNVAIFDGIYGLGFIFDNILRNCLLPNPWFVFIDQTMAAVFERCYQIGSIFLWWVDQRKQETCGDIGCQSSRFFTRKLQGGRLVKEIKKSTVRIFFLFSFAGSLLFSLSSRVSKNNNRQSWKESVSFQQILIRLMARDL